MNTTDSHLVDPSLWQGSCLASESTLHQIAPYIGKMKSTMARALIKTYSRPGDIVLDPFVGSGVVALECVISKRGIIASDINPYAITLTKAKLTAPLSLEEAINKATFYLVRMKKSLRKVSLYRVPEWVKAFFHARTLQELLALVPLLRRNQEHFLLACLLGILHHQRPGFLSFPASHLVPYLRTHKFPRNQFPELYKYRDVESRLLKKIARVYRRFPQIDPDVPKECKPMDAAKLDLPLNSVNAVITSPPYMNALDYVRDNRLRLWFLVDSRKLHYSWNGSYNIKIFLSTMEQCLNGIHRALKTNGKCVLVMGEVRSRKMPINTGELVIDLAVKKMGSFKCEDVIRDYIPDIRRARKEGSRTKREWIVVLRKGGY